MADELGLKTPIVSYQGGMIKENNENGEVYYRKDLVFTLYLYSDN